MTDYKQFLAVPSVHVVVDFQNSQILKNIHHEKTWERYKSSRVNFIIDDSTSIFVDIVICNHIQCIGTEKFWLTEMYRITIVPKAYQAIICYGRKEISVWWYRKRWFQAIGKFIAQKNNRNRNPWWPKWFDFTFFLYCF